MTVLWGILICAGSLTVGFYLGARYAGRNLAKILCKFNDAQLAQLADEVLKERTRGHTG